MPQGSLWQPAPTPLVGPLSGACFFCPKVGDWCTKGGAGLVPVLKPALLVVCPAGLVNRASYSSWVAIGPSCHWAWARLQPVPAGPILQAGICYVVFRHMADASPGFCVTYPGVGHTVLRVHSGRLVLGLFLFGPRHSRPCSCQVRLFDLCCLVQCFVLLALQLQQSCWCWSNACSSAFAWYGGGSVVERAATPDAVTDGWLLPAWWFMC
jgi:hypothetical protein